MPYHSSTYHMSIETLTEWLRRHPEDYPLTIVSAECVLERDNDSICAYAVKAADRTIQSFANQANARYQRHYQKS